jgi:inositol polyphosphate 5-phosphatase INPP5B/F
MDPYTPLFAALRPGQEQVKVAIECELPRKSAATISSLSSLSGFETNDSKLSESTSGLEDDDATTTGSSVDAITGPSNTSDPFANRRIYALVTNVEQGYEEGCIFVFKRRRNDPTKVKIVDGLPILPGFKASVQQVARTVGENAIATNSTSDLQIDMSLAGKSISASSSDTQSIRDLLKVVRETASRAEEVAIERQRNGKEDPTSQRHLHLHRHHHPHSTNHPTHAWVEHYMDVDRTLSGDQTPIFSRFTTSAFLPSRTERPRAPSPAAGEVKVSFGTFNVNAQVPSFGTSSTSLNSWLHVLEDEPDILIIALQEVDSSGLSYVVWTPQVETAWSDGIESSMGREANSYRKLASKQLVGVLLFAYVRTSLLPRIGSPALASVGVGFGGWAANKGAVAIRFTLDDISLCFVGSHLSAFSTPEARERRRWDHHEIVKRVKFVFLEDYEGEKAETERKELESKDAIESAAESALREQLRRSSILSTNDARGKSSSSSAADATMAETELGNDISESAELQQWTIYDHDIVFWGGDLNSRLDLNTFEVKKLIRKRQFESTLLKFDQLRSELSSRASFENFKEQEIDFPPTYKFDRGTNTYDTSEKQRCPAWTDRILWKEKDSFSRVQPIGYESAHNIRLSDHKPVLATFLLRISDE